MNIDKLVLIVGIVFIAATALLWVTGVLATTFSLHPLLGLVALALIGLAAYIMGRIILDRLNSREDDYYDRMKH